MKTRKKLSLLFYLKALILLAIYNRTVVSYFLVIFSFFLFFVFLFMSGLRRFDLSLLHFRLCFRGISGVLFRVGWQWRVTSAYLSSSIPSLWEYIEVLPSTFIKCLIMQVTSLGSCWEFLSCSLYVGFCNYVSFALRSLRVQVAPTIISFTSNFLGLNSTP
jgi:hypothetical protein